MYEVRGRAANVCIFQVPTQARSKADVFLAAQVDPQIPAPALLKLQQLARETAWRLLSPLISGSRNPAGRTSLKITGIHLTKPTAACDKSGVFVRPTRAEIMF